MSRKMYSNKLTCQQKCDGTCSVYNNQFICQSNILTYQQNECDTRCNGQSCTIQTFSGKNLKMPVYVCPDQLKTKDSCTCDVACDLVNNNQYVCFAEQHKQVCQSTCGVECVIQNNHYVCPEKAGAAALEQCNSKCKEECVYIDNEGFQCPKSQNRAGTFILLAFLVILAVTTIIIVAYCYRKKQNADDKKAQGDSELGLAESDGIRSFHKYNLTPAFMETSEKVPEKVQNDVVVPATIAVDTVATPAVEQKETNKISVKKIKAQPEFPTVIVPIDQLSPEMQELIPKQICLPDKSVFIITGVRFE